MDEALQGVLEAREKRAQIATNPKGFFVHVRVPEHVAERLREIQKTVLPAHSTPQEIDHVTLVYTKKALEDHAPEAVHAALDAMRRHGETVEPIDARLQGWAYFDGASSDGQPATALVALVDAPGLDHLHVDLSRLLKEHGIFPSANHIFTPHITLGYLPQHGRAEKDLPPIDGSFTIDKAHVAARDHHEVPLSGGPSLGQKAAAFVLSPTARTGLIGAGIGGALGAGAAAADYATDSPEERHRQGLLKRMLINGGVGAVGGGLVGAAHKLSPTAVDPDGQIRFASLGEEAARKASK
jgi:2'-5' RNA ligase